MLYVQTRRWCASTAVVAFLTLNGAGLAYGQASAPDAQTASGDVADARDGSPGDPLIVITALRDPANVSASVGVLGTRTALQTPFSINTFDAERIANQQANTLQEALRNEPALNGGVGASGYTSQPNFRGYRTTLLFDGLPLFDLLGTGNPNLTQFERIDVLKGASSFLYAATAQPEVGGAINHVPKTPLSRAYNAFALSYYEPGYVEGQADISRRFGGNDEFGARLIAVYGEGDTAVDKANDKRINTTLSLSYVAGDIRVTAIGGYDKVRNNSFREGVMLDPGIALPKPPSNNRNPNPDWSFIENESVFGYLKGEWTFAPNWSISSQVALTETQNPGLSTFGSITGSDGELTLSPYGFFLNGSSLRNFVVQATLRGTFDTGPISHELVVSGSRFRDRASASFDGVTLQDGSWSFVSNLYAPVEVPRPIVSLAPKALFRRNFSNSVSVSDIMTLGSVSVLGGVRYVELGTRRYDQATGDKFADTSQHATTPIGSVFYKPTEQSLLYFTYAQSFEQGGTAPLTAVNASEQLAPGRTEQYEIGAKITLGRILLTAALFDMKRPFEYLNADNVYGQAGTQAHKGLELQAIGSLSEALSISVGAMFLDPKVKNTGDPLTEGNRPSGVPRFTLPIYIDYAPEFIPGLHVNAMLTHFGKQAYDETNTRTLKAWSRFDLGARYEIPIGNQTVTARLNVENIFNHDYWQSVIYGAIFQGSPRTMKLSLSTHF